MKLIKQLPNDVIAVIDGEVEIVTDDNPLWINVHRVEGISHLDEEITVDGQTIPTGAVLSMTIVGEAYVIVFPGWTHENLGEWVNS